MRKRNNQMIRMFLGMMVILLVLPATACSKKTYLDVKTLFDDEEGLTYTEDTVSFDRRRSAKLFRDGTVEEGEGFVVSYTVQGNDPEYLYANSGGLYVELEEEVEEEIEGFGKNLWHNLIIFHDPWGQMHASACMWIIENGPYAQKDDGAFYKTDMAFAKASNPIDVMIVYYNEAYYVSLDNSCKVKLTADMVPAQEERMNTETFFKAGKRKIGLRSAGTGATFSKINYSIGNEAALEALKEMKMDE